MEKYIDINENGYSVRCKLFYQKDFRNIPNLVICTHGFGGNKENHSAAKFAQQLITSSETVSEIAARMDEPDTKSLSRRFRALKGCTPTEYRKKKLRKL